MSTLILTFLKMKKPKYYVRFVIEYNEEQKEYHIQTLLQRLGMPKYGWELIGIYNSKQQAMEALEKIKDDNCRRNKRKNRSRK